MLSIEHLSKTYHTGGQTTAALEDVSFNIEDGRFVTLIGPSGCGKSTLFRLIVGLEQPDSGRVCMDDRPLDERLGRFGYMPQRDLLLPWRTVLRNAVLAAEVDGRDTAEARRQATEMLPLFGLEGFGDAYPATLSGGMRQRAALLRTFLSQRDVLLLDEPFGALDALTRRDLQQWLLRDVWHTLQKTILFITHDVDEALLLGDRVVVLSPRPGRVAQNIAVPFDRPRSADTMLLPAFSELKAQLFRHLES